MTDWTSSGHPTWEEMLERAEGVDEVPERALAPLPATVATTTTGTDVTVGAYYFPLSQSAPAYAPMPAAAAATQTVADVTLGSHYFSVPGSATSPAQLPATATVTTPEFDEAADYLFQFFGTSALAPTTRPTPATTSSGFYDPADSFFFGTHQTEPGPTGMPDMLGGRRMESSPSGQALEVAAFGKARVVQDDNDAQSRIAGGATGDAIGLAASTGSRGAGAEEAGEPVKKKANTDNRKKANADKMVIKNRYLGSMFWDIMVETVRGLPEDARAPVIARFRDAIEMAKNFEPGSAQDEPAAGAAGAPTADPPAAGPVRRQKTSKGTFVMHLSHGRDMVKAMESE